MQRQIHFASPRGTTLLVQEDLSADEHRRNVKKMKAD